MTVCIDVAAFVFYALLIVICFIEELNNKKTPGFKPGAFRIGNSRFRGDDIS